MPRHHPDPRQQLDALREQLHHAEQAVLDAQAAVARALLAHQPTGPARERLAACVQRQIEIEDLIQALQQRLDRDQQDAADRRAAELCEQIGQSIQSYLDKFPTAVLPEFTA